MRPDLDQFRNAIMQSANLANTGSTMNGTGADIGHIQDAMGFDMRNSVAKSAGGNATQASGQIAQNEAEQAAAAKKRNEDAMAAKLQKLQNIDDPSKYIRQPNDKGGYDFFNPDGQPIDATEFAKRTRQHVSQALQGSEDPYDQDFMKDYKIVKDLGAVMSSGDSKARDKLFKENPGLQDEVKGQTFEGIVREFKQTYPSYFTKSQAAAPVQNVIHDKMAVGGDLRSNFQKMRDSIMNRKRDPQAGISWG